MSQKLYIGVDLGVHENVAFRSDNESVKKISFNPPKLKAWLDELELLTSEERPVVLLVESPKSPLVAAALSRGIQIESINPLKAANFRKAITVANAKDDVRDARALVAFKKAYPQVFRPLHVEMIGVQVLRMLLSQRETVIEDTVRLGNRLRQLLYLAFPVLLVAIPRGLERQWFLKLLKVAPTSHDAHLIKAPSDLKRLRKALQVETDEEARARLSENPSLPKDQVYKSIQEQIRWESQRLLDLLQRETALKRRLRKILKELEKEQQEKCAQSSEKSGTPGSITIMRSFPGMGPIILAALISELPMLAEGELPDIKTLRAFSGVRPVTHQSGGHHSVVMRRARNLRLNNALLLLARVSMQHDQARKRRYRQLRQRGKSYQTSLRIAASSILDILYAMLRDKTTYSPRAAAA